MATLKEQRNEALKAAQAMLTPIIAREKSGGARMTNAETEAIEAKHAEVKALDVKIETAAKSAALLEAIGGTGGASHGGTSFLNMRGVTAEAMHGMKAYADATSPHAKGLTPAGQTVANIPLVNTDPLAGGMIHERTPRLVDVLPAIQRESPVYSFLRQAVIASPGGAEVVAPGAVKPTKKLGVERANSRLRVIAVLSEPVDKYLLEDASNLRTWVGTELGDAIEAELEQQVLTGTGAGEEFQGLATLSGIQTQAFTADPLVTVQHGLSKLQTLGIEASFVALSPTDWLTIQTTRNAGGGFDVGGPIDATNRTAWGTPVVVVAGLAAGSGYVVGKESLVISTDGQGVRIEWGTPGDSFTRNQIVARVEGRFNLDAPKPHGVVKLALTA